MEFAALVPEAFLAGAKSTEVFDSLWDYMVVELEVDATNFGWRTWQSAWASTCENAVGELTAPTTTVSVKRQQR